MYILKSNGMKRYIIYTICIENDIKTVLLIYIWKKKRKKRYKKKI